MTIDQQTASRLSANAPCTLTLDKQYLLRPFKPGDLIGLIRFVQSKNKGPGPLDEIKDVLASVPPETQRIMIEEAYKRHDDRIKKHTDPESLKNDPMFVAMSMFSPDGAAYLFWLLAKPQHPDLTFEKARALVTDDNVVDVAGELLNAMNMGEALPNSDGRKSS